jgi:Peptidase S46
LRKERTTLQRFVVLRWIEVLRDRADEVKDVRLVYAPADGIGVFGGETEDWRWPRLGAIKPLCSGKKTPYLDSSFGVSSTAHMSPSHPTSMFDPVTTRSIHVDARYMLWNMAEVDGATNLLRETAGAPAISARF